MFDDIVHLIWLQGEDLIPLKYQANLDSWRNFATTVIVWDGEMIRNLLVRYFPLLVPTYDNYPIFVQKCDLGRYLILYLYGGLYVDMDVKLKDGCEDQLAETLELTPADKIAMPGADLGYFAIPPFDSRIRNWMIYARVPYHRFFSRCLKVLPRVADRRWSQMRSYYVAASTGSVFLTNQLSKVKCWHRIEIRDLIENSYASSWGGLYYLDDQDRCLIAALVVIVLVIVVVAIWGLVRGSKPDASQGEKSLDCESMVKVTRWDTILQMGNKLKDDCGFGAIYR